MIIRGCSECLCGSEDICFKGPRKQLTSTINFHRKSSFADVLPHYTSRAKNELKILSSGRLLSDYMRTPSPHNQSFEK